MPKVKKLKPKVLRIRVTKEHISRGTPRTPDYCPIALALRAKGLKGVSVGTQFIEFEMPDTGEDVELGAPRCIREFIMNFDTTESEGLGCDNRHKLVKPFGFKLQLPLELPGRVLC